ncbi:hypothetical protein ACP70R_025000 [Stipagrostis hirtigluma subsp. patula]
MASIDFWRRFSELLRRFEMPCISRCAVVMVAAELGGAAVDAEPEQAACGGEGTGEPSAAIHEVMKRMKYERKISASLYALSGVSECLRMRLGGGGDHAGATAHETALSGLRDACRKKQQEQQQLVEEGGNVGNEESSSSSSSSPEVASSSPEAASAPSEANAVDSDVLLWSSLDLPPIC